MSDSNYDDLSLFYFKNYYVRKSIDPYFPVFLIGRRVMMRMSGKSFKSFFYFLDHFMS